MSLNAGWMQLYLFLGNRHVICDVSEDSGLNEATVIAYPASPGLQLGTLLFATFNQRQNLLCLFGVNLKTSHVIDIYTCCIKALIFMTYM